MRLIVMNCLTALNLIIIVINISNICDGNIHMPTKAAFIWLEIIIVELITAI